MVRWYVITEALSDVKAIATIYHDNRKIAYINGPTVEDAEKHAHGVLRSLIALERPTPDIDVGFFGETLLKTA